MTGTPVVDPDTRAVYAADAFGWLHGLDLVTGAERPGWPVRLFTDYTNEHVWGALVRAGGSVYVPTGSFCDGRPMEGKLIRVALATGAITSWLPVPAQLGGGGGIWSLGGAAYDARRGSLYVATGNAFRGGTNVGRSFRESAGLGERIVELSLDLKVRSENHPRDVRQQLDLDFSGGPIVAKRPGCPELVAALNKNGRLYAWRSGRLRAGPVWSARLRGGNEYVPAIGQPAWSPRHRSFFFAIGNRLTRLGVSEACRPHVVWRVPIPHAYTHGSPTVADDGIWLSVSGAETGLLAVDARTGKVRTRIRLDGDAYGAPAALDGALYVGTFSGALHGLVPRRARFGNSFSAAPGHTSFLDARRGWQGRESGVYATADGGAHWRRILAMPAERVVRASPRFGAVSTSLPAPRCACRSRVFWTRDGGRSWRETAAIRGPFEGRGNVLYWRDRGRLFVTRIAQRGRRLRSRSVARIRDGVIVDLANVPSGVAALVSSRMHGRGWDQQPRLLVASGGESVKLVRLPLLDGAIVVRSLEAAWPNVIVRGRDYTRFADVTWTSGDGGASWQVSRK